MFTSLQSLVGRIVPLSFLSSRTYDTLVDIPPPFNSSPVPPASWVESRKDITGQPLPQSVAHRGLRAKYPENTMIAFRSAVLDANADGLETDIHLTRDDVVVLSHDANLRRCFGDEKSIIDVDYSYVQNLRTLRQPRQPMPRLDELLKFLAEDIPGRENVWLLLDIKMDNDAENVLRQIIATISSVAPNPRRPWNQRIVMGIWAYKYLPICEHFAPNFPVTYIGFSTNYAGRFLSPEHANVGFNFLTQSLYLNPAFITAAHRSQRPVFAWTVNEEEWMRWCIFAKLDTVITDDPGQFNEVKRQWVSGRTEVGLGWRMKLQTAWLRVLIFIMNSVLAWKASRKKQR